jgi:hypothetical protein
MMFVEASSTASWTAYTSDSFKQDALAKCVT